MAFGADLTLPRIAPALVKWWAWIRASHFYTVTAGSKDHCYRGIVGKVRT